VRYHTIVYLEARTLVDPEVDLGLLGIEESQQILNSRADTALDASFTRVLFQRVRRPGQRPDGLCAQKNSMAPQGPLPAVTTMEFAQRDTDRASWHKSMGGDRITIGQKPRSSSWTMGAALLLRRRDPGAQQGESRKGPDDQHYP
jgi:hypothetical protein